jgi:hypothetical protein
MIETALRAQLLATPAVTALVGQRIYALILPQKPQGGAGWVPAVTYQRIAAIRENALDGATGLVGVRFQVDSWALTYAEVKDLAAAVRGALNGFAGAVGGENVQGSFLLADTDRYESEVELFRVSQDFRVWHREAAA